MKRKELEWRLEMLEVFNCPNALLEQYITGPELAASILQVVAGECASLEGKLVADLGSGCGHLLIGASLLGAGFCVGFEIDPAAIDICIRNLASSGTNQSVDLLLCDVVQLADSPSLKEAFHTVLLNPPFGTKHNRGIDLHFLDTALHLASESVFSLHKTSTREFVLNHVSKRGINGKVVAELHYDLPATYRYHKQRSVDILVDFIRFDKKCK